MAKPHPLARHHESLCLILLKFTVYIVTAVVLLPLKLIITFGTLIWASWKASTINLSDAFKPLTKRDSNVFYHWTPIVGKLVALGHGLLLVEKDKHLRDKSANLICGNHCSYLDSMIMATIGGGSAVVN